MMSRDGYTDSEKAMMQLSRETLEGLHITGETSHTPIYFCYCTYYFTVKSLTITRYLMSFPEVKGHYLLSERFSQDPIQNYLGNNVAMVGDVIIPLWMLYLQQHSHCMYKAPKLCFQCKEILVLRGE